MKETTQQKKVTAAAVRNNLEQGFDGRVGSYLYGGKGAEQLVSLVAIFVQGFENLVEIITKKNHREAFIIAHIEIPVGLCSRKRFVEFTSTSK